MDTLRNMALGPFFLTWNGAYDLPVDDLILPFCRRSLPAGLPPEQLIPVCTRFAHIKSLAVGQMIPGPGFSDMYKTPRGRLLVSHMNQPAPSFAVYVDEITPGSGIECFFDPSLCRTPRHFTSLTVLSRLCLHRALLFREMGVLHASYIDVGGEAILFTAPSGTGKSTQADLWQQYTGAEIINGDRALLGFSDGVPYAHGYPVCGSSRISKDRSLPIRAIVLLNQGPENLVTEPPMSEKIRCLLSATEVFRWDMTEIDCALSLARRMADSVPVVRFTCRPDGDAVKALATYLKIPKNK